MFAKITAKATSMAEIRPNGSTLPLSNLPSLVRLHGISVKSSSFKSDKKHDRPSPINMLNTGPARHPVTAISPNPFLVMATLAFMSPRQLPTAKSVNPKSAYGNPAMSPIIYRISMTTSDVHAIQIIAITNPTTAKMNIKTGGGCVFLVQKQM